MSPRTCVGTCSMISAGRLGRCVRLLLAIADSTDGVRRGLRNVLFGTRNAQLDNTQCVPHPCNAEVQLCGPGNIRNLMYLCMTPAYVHVSARNNRNLSYARQCKQLYAEALHSIFGVSAWSAAGSDRLRPMRAALGTLVLWLCTSAFLTAENGPARNGSHLSICLSLIMGAEASCTAVRSTS